MLFLVQNGFRVVAHDRRGHGRSSQTSSGNDMDDYADDLAAVIEALDLKDASLVGHSTGGDEVVPLQQITEAHFDKTFSINVKSTLFTAQKLLPLMPDGAWIIMNGSMASIKGMPAFSIYAATKAALRSFARTWSVELKTSKIRVNVVSPSTIITPGYKNELGLSDDEQIERIEMQAAAATPLSRAGTPDEIAKAVVFLASDDSSYISGIELFVDGGAAQKV
jgi:NAD(P)-dependent dehydrogenase (short-subunit alcohol dehydrogenase family)